MIFLSIGLDDGVPDVFRLLGHGCMVNQQTFTETLANIYTYWIINISMTRANLVIMINQ